MAGQADAEDVRHVVLAELLAGDRGAREGEAADIAPTLATLLGVAAPASSEGKALPLR